MISNRDNLPDFEGIPAIADRDRDPAVRLIPDYASEEVPRKTQDFQPLSAFAGRWVGSFHNELTKQTTDLYLYVKQGFNQELKAAAFYESGMFANMTGKFEGTGLQLKPKVGFRRFQRVRAEGHGLKSFTGTLSSEGEVQVLQGQVHAGDTFLGTWMARKDPAPGYALYYRPDLCYFMRANDVLGQSWLLVNGDAIACISSRAESGWVDVTPLLKQGENRLLYTHEQPSQYSEQWKFDFTVRRHLAGEREEVLYSRRKEARNDPQTGIKFHKTLVVPYFDQQQPRGLAEWSQTARHEPYLEEVLLTPIDVNVSSAPQDRWNLVDRTLETTWTSEPDDLEGERLTYEFGRAVVVDGMRIYNGRRGEDFKETSRIRRATVVAEGKRIAIAVEDRGGEQYFPLGGLGPASRVIVNVNGVYKGTEPRLALGELHFVARRPPSEDPESAAFDRILGEFPIGGQAPPGLEVVDHQNRKYLRLRQKEAAPGKVQPGILGSLRFNAALKGDFALEFDLVESGGTPDFRVQFLQPPHGGRRPFEITLREQDYRWHVWLPGRRYGWVGFDDDLNADTFRIAKVGEHWSVFVNGYEVVSAEIPCPAEFSRIKFEMPTAGRLFFLGNLKVKGR